MALPPEVIEALVSRALRLAGGALLVGAGSWLLFLDRRSAATRAFTLILAVTGLDIVRNALDDPFAEAGIVPMMAFVYAGEALALVGYAATLRFVTMFPRPRSWLGTDPRGGRLIVLGAVVLLALLAAFPGAFVASQAYPATPFTVLTSLPVSLVAAVVLAHAWLREPDADLRRSTALAATGFVAIAAFGAAFVTALLAQAAADGSLATTPLVVRFAETLLAAFFLPILARWAWAARRGADRVEALTFLAVLGASAAAGILARATAGSTVANTAGGVPSVLFALLVLYGVLRGRLFGIDVKVRWTLSKSTIAAVFIAVFFVASETAQQFFGDSLGGTYVGIAAAGMLVFALAPLQRAAERIAEKAVPVAGVPVPVAAADGRADREESYRRALRIALRDRALSREEEVHLHEVAEHMGIGAGRAMALRVGVERELEVERETGVR